MTQGQKVSMVHEVKFSTPSVSPPNLGEKNGPQTGSITPKRSWRCHPGYLSANSLPKTGISANLTELRDLCRAVSSPKFGGGVGGGCLDVR